MNRRNSVKRNPPSDGFQYIGSGAFSFVYAKGDKVESISSISDFNTVDISKWIISKVRPTLSENAKRFLPDIKLTRIDESYEGLVEYVYEMPLYYTGGPSFESESEYASSIALYHGLSEISNEIFKLGLTNFTSSLKFLIEKLEPICSDADYSGLSEALSALFVEINKYTGDEFFACFVYDIGYINMAFDKYQLILLDPFLLEVQEHQALWIIQSKPSTTARYLKGCLS